MLLYRQNKTTKQGDCLVKILNFGSVNVDHVYRLDHLVCPGETIQSQTYTQGCGGKGLNQSVALAMAGAPVYHAGLIGRGGGFLRTRLCDSGVDCSYLYDRNIPAGHAIIQVDREGQNSIVLYPGSNHALTKPLIEKVLAHFGPGDVLLLQNETNLVPFLITLAARQGMDVAFNAAPMGPEVRGYPLHDLRWLFVNETEGAALTGKTDPEDIAGTLCGRYPNLELILTLGCDGSVYRKGELQLSFPARQVRAVDTTAAGDSFTGYFLASAAAGADPGYAMSLATAAAALCVTRPGAADAIPALEEVLAFL